MSLSLFHLRVWVVINADCFQISQLSLSRRRPWWIVRHSTKPLRSPRREVFIGARLQAISFTFLFGCWLLVYFRFRNKGQTNTNTSTSKRTNKQRAKGTKAQIEIYIYYRLGGSSAQPNLIQFTNICIQISILIDSGPKNKVTNSQVSQESQDLQGGGPFASRAACDLLLSIVLARVVAWHPKKLSF